MSFEKAKKIKNKYKDKLRSTTHKATCGDKKAALDLMKMLAQYYTELKSIGFRETDETEDGPIRLVPITQEYIDFKRSKMKPSDLMRERIMNGQDTDENKRKLMELILEEIDK